MLPLNFTCVVNTTPSRFGYHSFIIYYKDHCVKLETQAMLSFSNSFRFLTWMQIQMWFAIKNHLNTEHISFSGIYSFVIHNTMIWIANNAIKWKHVNPRAIYICKCIQIFIFRTEYQMNAEQLTRHIISSIFTMHSFFFFLLLPLLLPSLEYIDDFSKII